MRDLIKRKKALFDRFVDCLPATVNILLLISLVFFSAYYPVVVAYILTTYFVFYAFESVRVGFLSYRAFRWVRQNQKVDWWKKVISSYGKDLDGFYQAVIIPFASEPLSVLEPTIKNLLKSNFPLDKLILVMATEVACPSGLDISKKIKEKYGDKFAYFLITEHLLVEGEAKGKAANENFAGRKLYEFIKKKNIDPKKVVVTSLDSDMKPDPQFLAMLTYNFFKEGKMRHKRIFQPLPINLEKAWESITPARLIASFGFQYFSAKMQMPALLTNFSVYSASLHMIHAVGFWSPDVIPEDERFFWQSYFTYGLDVRVVPLFIPVYGDIIVGDNVWDAVKEQYKQIRRWAWGATEIKYFLYNAILDKKIPLWDKFIKLLLRFRVHSEWVLLPVILSIGNSLPSMLNEEYKKNPMAYLIPLFTSRTLTFLLLSFVLLIVMDYYFSPKKPEDWRPHKTLITYLSWGIFPFVSFFFSAFPAFEAQFRMLINKPIIYIETKKR